MNSKQSRVRRKPHSSKVLRKVLVVEDDDVEREITAEFLRKDGYVVLEASTRPGAIRVLETKPSDAESTTWRPVDAVVTALTVPELEDGFALLEWMRDYGPDVPAIVVSAATSEETVNKALELGAFEYVMKPVALEDLRAVVKNATRLKTLKSEQAELDGILSEGIVFSLLWLAGIGSFIAFRSGLRARRLIASSRGSLQGIGRAWWCLIVGAAGVAFCIAVVLALLLVAFPAYR